ncbi:GNAT family N-acetyltransferase [Sulfitobacter sp. LCG007]
MQDRLLIRQMSRAEVDTLVGWAAAEGWNPGRHDAELFWASDRDAFIAAEFEGELVGGGAITAYQGAFGFMGFFIVRPKFRRRGLGDRLWHARLARLRDRLDPGATIGMDGVFDMQPYYAKGGFVLSHRDIRFRADEITPRGPADDRIVALDTLPPGALADLDRQCFPARRPEFLARWISQPDALALGCLREGVLRGYGVIRACVEGSKIGPLFAENPETAGALFDQLAAHGAGGPVFLDVPENNPAALSLVRARGMHEVFGCARMYLGPAPDITHRKIFGVTTFEFG